MISRSTFNEIGIRIGVSIVNGQEGDKPQKIESTNLNTKIVGGDVVVVRVIVARGKGPGYDSHYHTKNFHFKFTLSFFLYNIPSSSS